MGQREHVSRRSETGFFNWRFASSQSLLWSPDIECRARFSAIRYARKRICSSEGGAGLASTPDFAGVFLRVRTLLGAVFFAPGLFTREPVPFALSVWTSLDFFGTD